MGRRGHFQLGMASPFDQSNYVSNGTPINSPLSRGSHQDHSSTKLPVGTRVLIIIGTASLSWLLITAISYAIAVWS